MEFYRRLAGATILVGMAMAFYFSLASSYLERRGTCEYLLQSYQSQRMRTKKSMATCQERLSKLLEEEVDLREDKGKEKAKEFDLVLEACLQSLSRKDKKVKSLREKISKGCPSQFSPSLYSKN